MCTVPSWHTRTKLRTPWTSILEPVCLYTSIACVLPLLCMTCLQNPKLEHVGILHHHPNGSIAFLHRTSGGKVNFMGTDIFRAMYITPPLHPKVAFDMFEGAAEVGNYRYPIDRINYTVLASCKLQDGGDLLYKPACGDSMQQADAPTLPVPVMTPDMLPGSRLKSLLEASYQRFADLSALMQQPEQTVLKQLMHWKRLLL